MILTYNSEQRPGWLLVPPCATQYFCCCTAQQRFNSKLKLLPPAALNAHVYRYFSFLLLSLCPTPSFPPVRPHPCYAKTQHQVELQEVLLKTKGLFAAEVRHFSTITPPHRCCRRCRRPRCWWCCTVVVFDVVHSSRG